MLRGIENNPSNGEILQILEEINFPSQLDNQNIKNVKAFGLNNGFNNEWRFGYYVGVDYLDDGFEFPVIVDPKFDNINYFEMFKTCLEFPETTMYLSNVFDIRIDKPFIHLPDDISNTFSILVIYHFMKILSDLVKRPLIKSYVIKNENLKSKIKGKILLGEHFKKNIANNRFNRIVCSFDEYSSDCPANRLLHSAYRICINYSKNQNLREITKYNFIESYFQNIGYIGNSYEISKIKVNSLFWEYKEALRIAKIIYKLKSYNENEENPNNFVRIPPYIIDMPKLFELYTLVLLKKAKINVNYQVHGNYGYVDFLDYDHKIIIDTKYKKIYDEEKKFNIDDIRQVSAYARDKRLLKNLYKDNTWETTIPKCLIIYPDENINNMTINSAELLNAPIEQFNEFYKYGLKLP